MDPYTLNPYRILRDPLKETLMVPLKDPYFGTWGPLGVKDWLTILESMGFRVLGFRVLGFRV